MRGVLIGLGALATLGGGLSMILVWIAWHGNEDQTEHNKVEIYKLWGGLVGLAGIVLMLIAARYV